MSYFEKWNNFKKTVLKPCLLKSEIKLWMKMGVWVGFPK